jgi:pimeloyl-ACP methyl ester carboxylesterase
MLAALVGAALLSVLGCSYGITVRRASGPELLRDVRASVSEWSDLSPRTLQTLHRLDLETSYKKRPEDTYRYLQGFAADHPAPDVLFALAEISYQFGRKAEKKGHPGACAFYYRCAGYAYHYLFPRGADVAWLGAQSPGSPVPLAGEVFGRSAGDHDDGAVTFAYDPRFRLACDLYNVGLSKCIVAAQKVGRLDPRQQLFIPTPDGKGFTLSVVHHGFPWKPEEFGPLVLCSDYEVVGLANHYRGYGLGVAMIGIRDPQIQARDNAAVWADRHVRARSADEDLPDRLSPMDLGRKTPEGSLRSPSGVDVPIKTNRVPRLEVARPVGRFPHEVSFPVTAFFRFEGDVRDLGTQHSGRLELYNPLTIQTVQIDARSVPLETDLTTPLAYFLSRTDLEGIEYKGFLAADKIRDRTGIYMFEPYQPGKIPVVMVHGLLSSPLTWTTMFNDLRADPVLRERFQFWFYLYPTGNPYLATAADLRQELRQLRDEYDPAGKDPALDHMVLVGHSMGGLVSRLLTVDSGDAFWNLVSPRPLDDLRISQDSRSELRRVFYFRRQDCVEREIFLATPHHGSKLSPSPPARLAARFIRLPQNLVTAATDLAHAEPGEGHRLHNAQICNSIDLLDPKSPALEQLAALPLPRHIHFHSIMGEIFGEGEKSSDGVVPYTSAHLDGVDSEVLVSASHLVVHHHPRAVLEVRRILLEHLKQVQSEDGVIPAEHREMPNETSGSHLDPRQHIKVSPSAAPAPAPRTATPPPPPAPAP